MNFLTALLLALCALQFAQAVVPTIADKAIASDGKGNFVAVQEKPYPYQVFYSSDAVTWTNASITGTPDEGLTASLFYINGTFVIFWSDWFDGWAVSYVSQDGGKSFQRVRINAAIGSPVLLLTNGPKQTLAAIETQWEGIIVSSNGINWDHYPIADYTSGWQGAGSVMIVPQEYDANNGTYLVSQDGTNWITWKISTFGKDYVAADFATGKSDDEIIAYVSTQQQSGEAPAIFTTSDLGKTWQLRAASYPGIPFDTAYVAGYYVTIVYYGESHTPVTDILISKDLATWHSAPHPFEIPTRLVVVEDILFVTFPEGYAFTKNLVDWTVPTGN